MATANVASWDLFRSDLKLSKITIKRELPSIQFDIPILSQPPKYKPGRGPPPPRIDLRLVHDTNAFIIDKIVLPLEPFTQRNDPRQRRIYYIIGWPDLPAARPVIDATKILDYVSPRALEDWEYQNALRREEAREAEERAEERAEEKGKNVATPEGPAAGPKPGVKRKPGRPPKARFMDAPPPEPVLDSDQEEMLQRRKSGPSLSTPQKNRLAQLVAEEEMLEHLEVIEEDDPVSVIQRQLEDGILSGEDMDLDADANMEEAGAIDLRQSSSAASATSGASRGNTSRASGSRLGPVTGPPVNPAAILARGAISAAATARATPLSTPGRQDADLSTSPSSGRTWAPTAWPLSNTPIPLPAYIAQSQKSKSSTPKPKPQAKPQLTSVLPSIEMSTPVGNDQNANLTFSRSEASEPMDRKPPLSLKLSPARGNGFTPIGGTFPRPPKRPVEDTSPAVDTPTSTQSKKKRKKKSAKVSDRPPESGVKDDAHSAANPPISLVQGEQDYVVKRLEGDYILDGVHWFKVRWEGSWPPDQNPTWEPKENISAKLVKEYLKTKAKCEAEKSSKNNTPNGTSSSTGNSKDKRQSSLAEWAKRYNSVSEAFEGKAELEDTTVMMLGRRGGGVVDDEESLGDDELLVVEPDNEEDRERAAKERKKSLDAQLAAQFASMARRGAREY
ncbi:hypothetical protein VP1G_08158 [Cytospora mali]|uniref:Chromo domain-containing protein n=1 Tax=Cytospora mali TaxID=578113 RepID=A0A194VAW5_CYTMA|nr:hypothetical protein VP1G_08158 [Valsa mali var. pyri (nom. inval.)]